MISVAYIWENWTCSILAQFQWWNHLQLLNWFQKYQYFEKNTLQSQIIMERMIERKNAEHESINENLEDFFKKVALFL